MKWWLNLHIHTFYLTKTIGSKVQFVVEWGEKKRDEDDELNGSKLRKTVSNGSDLFSVDKEITVLSFFASSYSVASKNNRIIIKPGRTHACVLFAWPHYWANVSPITGLFNGRWSCKRKKRREIDEEDDAGQRTWRYVCIYVCMAVIKLRLDTQLQAVVIGLKSADGEWWLLVIMNEVDWLLLFLFQASRGTTLILLVFFFFFIYIGLSCQHEPCGKI